MMQTYMFPGQGSQYRGMGADLIERFYGEVNKSSEIMGFDLKDICLNNQDDMLSKTQFTQPCLYLINCLHYLALMEDKKIVPDFVCGHSLGEYAALFASNVFDLYTGLKLVKKRGELMSEIKNGSLTAIIGDDTNNVMPLLQSEGLSEIEAANLNTSQQIVIGGLEENLLKAENLLELKGYRCVRLNVSGAFHTHYMETARIKFMKYLMDFKFSKPEIPLICSSTIQFFQEKFAIEILGFQITKPVNWLKTIQKLHLLGTTLFTEVGPGEVLTRMTKKILQ